jgi:hypothetical protein
MAEFDEPGAPAALRTTIPQETYAGQSGDRAGRAQNTGVADDRPLSRRRRLVGQFVCPKINPDNSGLRTMDDRRQETTDRRVSFSKAVKALRRRRGMAKSVVADALGMPVRSYEYFESGRGRLNVLRVHEVARILQADPFALLIAVDIGSPDFAVRSIDNKLASILVMAVADFDAAAADHIPLLDPATLIGAFRKVFEGLASQARERAAAGSWRLSIGSDEEPERPDDWTDDGAD